jgi:hypothetical protein
VPDSSQNWDCRVHTDAQQKQIPRAQVRAEMPHQQRAAEDDAPPALLVVDVYGVAGGLLARLEPLVLRALQLTEIDT